MKKFLMAAALVLFSANTARAQTVLPYNPAFSAKINQSLKYLSRGINMGTIADGSPAGYTSADYTQLKKLGITHLRIPVLMNLIVAGAPRPETGVSTPADVEAALAKLDGLVASFLQHGFYVTICVFSNAAIMALPDQQSGALTLQADQIISARYAKINPEKIFFELLNEPHYTPEVWNGLAPELVAAVRKNALNNTIILDSAWNAIPTNLPALTIVSDTNVIYNMHVYQPARLTTQGSLAPVDPNYLFPRPAGATGQKGSETSQEMTPESLAKYVLTGIHWAQINKVPLMMNEFGSSNLCDLQSRINWLSFMRQIADDNNIPWAYWGYNALHSPLTGNYDPVLLNALGRTPTLINFGINFNTGLAL